MSIWIILGKIILNLFIKSHFDTIMKILLINYAYFIIGGPERYMFNVKQLLEEHRHVVIPFSMDY